ncbi:MAG: hypothetical protein DME10_18610 [Candidatus Rokuibacteriota bacterium]|nr:MAG: hypothetical protein DME10_18610 [Candidatus Rokubacteria bacterium]
MGLEWDQRKSAANLRQHGIGFADAATVLHDDYAITIPEEGPDEGRFVTTGMDALGRVLVVVYTWRENRVRIISARAATSRERRQHERTR